MKREKERKSRKIAVGGGSGDVTEYMDESKKRERLEVIIGSFPIFYIFNSFALETFM